MWIVIYFLHLILPISFPLRLWGRVERRGHGKLLKIKITLFTHHSYYRVSLIIILKFKLLLTDLHIQDIGDHKKHIFRKNCCQYDCVFVNTISWTNWERGLKFGVYLACNNGKKPILLSLYIKVTIWKWAKWFPNRPMKLCVDTAKLTEGLPPGKTRLPRQVGDTLLNLAT